MTIDFDAATRARMAAIEANWDERTPIHLASRFYDVAGRAAEDWFAAYEWADLGDLGGRDVLHLEYSLDGGAWRPTVRRRWPATPAASTISSRER